MDVEPDQNSDTSDIKTLPRRARFYHAKIDAGNLGTGEDYHKLRNVIVIFITTYDPFGKDRMVYTIKNRCMEEPNLTYEDGAMSIFLYTKGTEGNPPEDLQRLLHYMEHSSAENAQTEDLKNLHRMVTAVKQDGKVGFAYMKSFEREQKVRDEGIVIGEIRGKTNDIIELLSDLGPISEELRNKIQAEKNMDVLAVWLKAAARSNSLEEFESKLLER